MTKKQMNVEEINGRQFGWATCVVCGNRVEPELGGVRVNHHGNTISVCGPQCLRTFANEPDLYLARLAKAMSEHAFGTETTEEVCS
jgi:YHS domain-containing protein